MLIHYRSNNSGGSWWLKDAEWKALEAAGWSVVWGGLYFCHSRYSSASVPPGKPQPCASAEECTGHQRYERAQDVPEHDRFLGALATSANKDFTNVRDALVEFERVTGQRVSDEGCNCCGAPHAFNWNDESGNYDYCSGEDCLRYLYGEVPANLRDAVEQLVRYRGR